MTPEFTSAELHARQGRLEGKLDAMDQRIGRLGERVGGIESTLAALQTNISRIVSFFYSNGKDRPSFETRFALLETEVRREIDTKERLKWLLIGLISAGMATFVGAVVVDALRRGVGSG